MTSRSETREQILNRLRSIADNPPEDIQPVIIRRRERPGEIPIHAPPCCPTCGKVL